MVEQSIPFFDREAKQWQCCGCMHLSEAGKVLAVVETVAAVGGVLLAVLAVVNGLFINPGSLKNDEISQITQFPKFFDLSPAPGQI
jgi:hypothetical protein